MHPSKSIQSMKLQLKLLHMIHLYMSIGGSCTAHVDSESESLQAIAVGRLSPLQNEGF